MSSKKERKKNKQNLPQPTNNPQIKKQLQLRSQSVTFSGPIPSPDNFERYNNILPGAAARILTMAENQSKHRLEIEKLVILSNIEKEKRAQHYGLTIGISGIIGAVICILGGYPAAGAILGSTSIAGLATVFVVGKRMAKKELERKKQTA